MSRSCQSATFSRPTSALPRTTRAIPQRRSAVIGLRLCGIADEPFCRRPNGSSTSPTSVRARCRISVAKRSSEEATSASAVEQLGVPVALQDLRRARSGLEAETLAGNALHLGIGGGIGADGARELADAQSLDRPGEPLPVAVEGERPARELEPERRRLGMDPVGAAHAERLAVLFGTRDDGDEGPIDALEQRAPPRPGRRAREPCRARRTRSARSGTSGLPRPAAPRPRRRMLPRRGSSRARSRPPAPGVGTTARSRIAATVSRGTAPTSAHPSSAASSTSSQRRSFSPSDQMWLMAGRA